ncbi:MAG: hypothetical protein QNJ04_03675 [Desulfobacterales bacterium]|nr:hypothetical protein [Desulfobacterales bacterium]
MVTPTQTYRRDWFTPSSPASLWPLAIGKKARYVETGCWRDQEGRWRTYKAHWRSEVAGWERIRTMAGEFDTWKIVAYHYSEGSAYGRPPRLHDARTWYYAPAVGHYVRYFKDYRGRKPTRRIDLVSVRPPLDNLKASVRTAIDRNFQQALEKKRSGQKLAWNLPRQAASGTTLPTATFRTAANRFAPSICPEDQSWVRRPGRLRDGLPGSGGPMADTPPVKPPAARYLPNACVRKHQPAGSRNMPPAGIVS